MFLLVLTCNILCLSWSAAAATPPCCSLPLPPLLKQPPLEVPACLPLPHPRSRLNFLTGLPEKELESQVVVIVGLEWLFRLNLSIKIVIM